MTVIVPPGMDPTSSTTAPNGVASEPPAGGGGGPAVIGTNVLWTQGSISALPDGRLELRMIDDSVVYVRRRTKLEFRELKFAYAEAEADYNRTIALGMFRLRQIGARDRSDETLEETTAALDEGDQIAAEFKDAGDLLVGRLVAWWEQIDEGNSEKYGAGCSPRLGPSDDWPSDLIDSKDVFQRIIDFWTHNP